MKSSSRKLNIAIVAGRFPVFSETFVLAHITDLINQGHQVDIYALEKGDQAEHKQFAQYQYSQKVVYLDAYIKANKVYSQYRREIIKLIFTHPLFVLPRLPLFFKFGFYNAAVALIKGKLFLKKRYDVVHCHFGPVANEMLFLMEIFPKTKLVTTFHGQDLSRIFSFEREGFYQKLFAKGDLFLPISRHFQQELIRLGAPSEKIRVQHMGINVSDFDFTPSDNDAKTKRLLTVGRFVPKKGHYYVLAAVKELASKYPDLEYWIVGDGPLEDDLKAAVKDFQIEKQVKFLGALDQSELQKLFKAVQVFVLTSVVAEDKDKEGIPVVLMEAMSSGVPVISTYHSGIPELVEHGVSGYLVPEKSITALAEQIEYVWTHPQQMRKIVEQARAKVLKEFNREQLQQDLEKIYQELTSE